MQIETPTPTAPETAAIPQPASSVESPTSAPVVPTPDTPSEKKPLAQMTSWEEYRASLAAPTEEAPAEAAPVDGPVEEGAEDEAGAEAPPPDAFDQYTLDDTGRLHRPDGTFADEQEVAAYNASVPADEEEPVEEAAPPATHTVELRTRDGSAKMIEVDDPELAELLRTNANDGMRASEYRRRVAAVDAKLAEFRAFESLLETNPESVILQHLPPEKQISIATALIAQHWDAIYDQMLGFEQDPTARLRTAMATQQQMREQERAYATTVQATQVAGHITAAVSALIPDGVDEGLEAQFYADAESDLVRAAREGQPVTPETVPALLARRLALYGFSATSSTTASPAQPTPAVRFAAAPAASPAVPTARPATDKAAQLAEQARAHAARIRQTQVTRQRAAAVPPQGAGAAPVRVPVVPKGASIEDVSRELKKHTSWASYTG